jgi:flagellar biosynthesis chaperone FliJ
MQSEDVLDKATKGVKALLTPKQIIAREQIVKAVLASNQAKFEKSTSISKKSNMNSFLNEYVSRIKENEKKNATKTEENKESQIKKLSDLQTRLNQFENVHEKETFINSKRRTYGNPIKLGTARSV